MELDKMEKNKAMNETVEYRIKMRAEELQSKTDLIKNYKTQIEQLTKKIQD